MRLSEALASAVTDKQRGARCSIALMLETVTAVDGAKEAAAIDALIKDPTRHAGALAKVLRENGHPVRDYTIRRHRSGECSC